jgi:hypothetical protein
VSERAIAWVVLFVDARQAPIMIGATVSPVADPIPPPEIERAERCAILCADGDTYAEAASAARALLAAPRWRWVWRLPHLGPGFRHEWEEPADGSEAACRRCRQVRGSRAVESWRLGRDVCLVSHAGRCAVCGELGAIVSGSTRCTSCEVEAAERRASSPSPSTSSTRSSSSARKPKKGKA